MKNCLVAQSGGPTAVINASVAGVVKGLIEKKCCNKVYGGVYGIEGILQNKLIDLSNLSSQQIEILKYTPSSSLGSCRYKLKDYKIDEREYEEFFNIMDQHHIHTLFYIGGNDSMDTVDKLDQYAKEKGIDKQIIGIPKTIDNDLCHTDHTPGFGSAAKYIATTVLETYLDASVYPNNGVFIIETMGRDTGWLAASAALANIGGESVPDFIYLPEIAFSTEKFIDDVARRYKEKNKVYIVASEGIKDEQGKFLFQLNKPEKHDAFSHVQLGGVSNYLKHVIMENGITSRVKALELGVTQRCAMHCVSETDINEAFRAGMDAVEYSIDGDSGFMVGIRRLSDKPYESISFKVSASEIANSIRYFPSDWINSQGNHVKEEAILYLSPLIQGQSSVPMEKGLPRYLSFVE
ncbi:MAG: 6-phosphofructokinase [Thermotaleaceae bacterium]